MTTMTTHNTMKIPTSKKINNALIEVAEVISLWAVTAAAILLMGLTWF